MGDALSTMIFAIWLLALAVFAWTVFKMVRSHDGKWVWALIVAAGFWVIAGYMSARLGSLEQAVQTVGDLFVGTAGSDLALVVGMLMLLVGIAAMFRHMAQESPLPRSRGATRVESS